MRPDLWELVDYVTDQKVVVTFSTNGVRITERWPSAGARNDYVDVQISWDAGAATPEPSLDHTHRTSLLGHVRDRCR